MALGAVSPAALLEVVTVAMDAASTGRVNITSVGFCSRATHCMCGHFATSVVCNKKGKWFYNKYKLTKFITTCGNFDTIFPNNSL